MNEFKHFGSPDLFEIAARWTIDEEPRDRLPKTSGWSMGDLQITVGNHVLTARRFGEVERNYISWYLHPVFDWLIKQWTWLLHEEMYSWSGNAGVPAAWASFAALARTIGSSDETEREEYRAIHNWWTRHALRAADSSALFPDICFRRVNDEIEISWTERQPVYAPDGLLLTLSPGFATLAVDAVAKPLWDFIQWGLKTAPASDLNDRHVVAELKTRLQRLKRTPLKDLESKYLRSRLQELLLTAAQTVPWQSDSTFVRGVPALASLDAAVLMFGGLAPSISERDAIQLLRFLKKHEAQPESATLLRLVDNRPLNLAIPPYYDGYELAEDFRDDFDIHSSESRINLQSLLHELGIAVDEVSLDTDSVRGVAIAGANFAPAILINTTSAFNKTAQGRKFTMAHELCHILFDRTRAKKLSHVSGAWTSARVEKRANAFAAMFLASRAAVKRTFTDATEEAIRKQAESLELGYSALIEHLYNLGFIDEADRDRLRAPALGN